MDELKQELKEALEKWEDLLYAYHAEFCSYCKVSDCDECKDQYNRIQELRKKYPLP